MIITSCEVLPFEHDFWMLLLADAVAALVALTLRAQESARTEPPGAPGQAGPAPAQGVGAECRGTLSKDRASARLRLRAADATRGRCSRGTDRATGSSDLT